MVPSVEVHEFAPGGHVPWPTTHWLPAHRIPAGQRGEQMGPGGGGFEVPGLAQGPLRSPSARRTFAAGLMTRIVCPSWQSVTFLPLPFFLFPLPLPLPPFLASPESVPRGGRRPPRAEPARRRRAVRREGVSERERSRASKRSVFMSWLLSCERGEVSDRRSQAPGGRQAVPLLPL